MLCCDPGLVSGLGVLHWTKEAGLERWMSLEGTLAEVGYETRNFLRDPARNRGNTEIVDRAVHHHRGDGQEQPGPVEPEGVRCHRVAGRRDLGRD